MTDKKQNKKETWTVSRTYLNQYTYEECISRIIRSHINK